MQQIPQKTWDKTYSMFPCTVARPVPKEAANKQQTTSSFKAIGDPQGAASPETSVAKFAGGNEVPLMKIQLNLQGLRPLAEATPSERCEVERAISGALGEFSGDLEGEYLPLPASTSHVARPEGMTEGEAAELRAAGLLFPFETPDARGVFATANGRAAVWINAGSCHVQGLIKEDASLPDAATRLDFLERAISAGLQQDGYAFKRTQVNSDGAFAQFSGSLVGLPPAPQMSPDELREVERVVSRALLEMSGELEGEYYPLRRSSSFPALPGGMLEADEVMLASKGFLFPFASPNGRGVYANTAKNAAVWVNEGSHVQIVVKRTGDDSQDMARAKNIEGVLRDAVKQTGYSLA